MPRVIDDGHKPPGAAAVTLFLSCQASMIQRNTLSISAARRYTGLPLTGLKHTGNISGGLADGSGRIPLQGAAYGNVSYAPGNRRCTVGKCSLKEGAANRGRHRAGRRGLSRVAAPFGPRWATAWIQRPRGFRTAPVNGGSPATVGSKNGGIYKPSRNVPVVAAQCGECPRRSLRSDQRVALEPNGRGSTRSPLSVT